MPFWSLLETIGVSIQIGLTLFFKFIILTYSLIHRPTKKELNQYFSITDLMLVH